MACSSVVVALAMSVKVMADTDNSVTSVFPVVAGRTSCFVCLTTSDQLCPNFQTPKQ